VWDTASVNLLFQVAADQDSPKGRAPGIVIYCTDGKRIVTDDGSTPQVFDAESGTRLLALAPRIEWLSDVRFSLDGNRIAVTDRSGKLKVQDSFTGQILLEMAAHTASINQIAYSPDRTRLATGGGDGRAQIFDATTDKLMLKIEMFPNRVNGIA